MIIRTVRFFPTNVYNDMYEDVVGHEWYAGTVECAYQNGMIDEHLVEGTMWRIAPRVMEKRTGRKSRRFPFMGTAVAAAAAVMLLVVGLNTIPPASNDAETPQQNMDTETAACWEMPAEASMNLTTEGIQNFGASIAGYTDSTAQTEAMDEEVRVEDEPTERNLDIMAPTVASADPSFKLWQWDQDEAAVALLWASEEDSLLWLGEPFVENDQVRDAGLWIESVFGSRILEGVPMEEGCFRMSLYMLEPAEAQALLDTRPDTLILSSGGEDSGCILIVAEEQK